MSKPMKGTGLLVALCILIFLAVLILIPQNYGGWKQQTYLDTTRDMRTLDQVDIVVTEKEKTQDVTTLAIAAPLKSDDAFTLSVNIYDAQEAKGLVQIIHGAYEHKELYDDFARALAAEGYAVIVSDTRGHGASVNEGFELGYMDGVDMLLDDQYLVTRVIKERYPDLPLTLVGHSFGANLAREYLANYDNELDSVILTGTPAPVDEVDLGIFAGRILAFYTGGHGQNGLLESMNNDNMEDLSWVSDDPSYVERLQSDPLFLDHYLNNGILTTFEANSRLEQLGAQSAQNPQLRILSITGDQDSSITGGEAGVATSLDSLRNAGYQEVESIEVQGKHSVIQGRDKEEVYQHVIDFLG